jgi:hypothetical protein
MEVIKLKVPEKIWYDGEGDYLEVIFERKVGYFRETRNDAVMEKVDEEGNIWFFHPKGECIERTRADFCQFALKINLILQEFLL